jgi:hypothetical protein
VLNRFLLQKFQGNSLKTKWQGFQQKVAHLSMISQDMFELHATRQKKVYRHDETDKNRNDYFGYIGRKMITSEIVVIAKL